MRQYWTKKDWRCKKKAKDFDELADVGLRILKRMPQPAEMVSGPISSGGLGSIKANLKEFGKYIRCLKKSGINVFDQMPFEKEMERIEKELYESRDHARDDILNKFYLRLFKSGLIKKLNFMPKWKSSIGARWERKIARKLKIKIADIV